MPKKEILRFTDEIDNEETLLRYCQAHRCPNTLPYIEFFEDFFNIYLVTEFMSGGTLSSELNRLGHQFPSESEAKVYFRQLATGLKGLHDHHIVHRDLKPTNVLISKSTRGAVKVIIADFGIACKMKNEQERLVIVAGSDGYIAPEVLRPKEKYSLPADIWSIGCILYYIMTDCLPFQSDTNENESSTQYDNKIMSETELDERSIHFNETMSPQLKDLLLCMLVKDQERRATIDQVLAHPWLQLA